VTHESRPQSVIDPALRRRLDAGEPVDVVVTFRSPPSETELATLGLRAGGARGELGYGRLDPAAVRTLAGRQDVASIGQRPAPSAGEPHAAAGDLADGDLVNVDPELVARLDAGPDELQRVAVWFRELPSDAELARLGLAGTGANPAVGMVDAAGIRRLAQRPDVTRIAVRPEPHAF